MGILLIIFLITFIFMVLFANIEVNGKKDLIFIDRIVPATILALIITVIIGLPILGLIHLILG